MPVPYCYMKGTYVSVSITMFIQLIQKYKKGKFLIIRWNESFKAIPECQAIKEAGQHSEFIVHRQAAKK